MDESALDDEIKVEEEELTEWYTVPTESIQQMPEKNQIQETSPPCAAAEAHTLLPDSNSGKESTNCDPGSTVTIKQEPEDFRGEESTNWDSGSTVTIKQEPEDFPGEAQLAQFEAVDVTAPVSFGSIITGARNGNAERLVIIKQEPCTEGLANGNAEQLVIVKQEPSTEEQLDPLAGVPNVSLVEKELGTDVKPALLNGSSVKKELEQIAAVDVTAPVSCGSIKTELTDGNAEQLVTIKQEPCTEEQLDPLAGVPNASLVQTELGAASSLDVKPPLPSSDVVKNEPEATASADEEDPASDNSEQDEPDVPASPEIVPIDSDSEMSEPDVTASASERSPTNVNLETGSCARTRARDNVKGAEEERRFTSTSSQPRSRTSRKQVIIKKTDAYEECRRNRGDNDDDDDSDDDWYRKKRKVLPLDGKPCWCHICGQFFTTRDVLEIHFTTHSLSHNFVCEECGEAFYQANVFNEHLDNHMYQKAKRKSKPSK